MQNSPHEDFSALFEQLGLPADDQSIADFIARHRLLSGQKIYEADFWNDGQKQFLRSALIQDAEWAMPVDALAVSLGA